MGKLEKMFGQIVVKQRWWIIAATVLIVATAAGGMLQPFIKDKETLTQLNKIIAEEKKHIEQLQEFKESETP